MVSHDSNERILANLEIIVDAEHAGDGMEDTMRTALFEFVEWLAARVPYKVPLPRGYMLHWTAQKGADGGVYRYHQLLKAAPGGLGVSGVWIDTAHLHQVERADVRTLARDIASGLLQEIVEFLAAHDQGR